VHVTSIVINEIMVKPDRLNDTIGEWFELYNAGTTTVNLQNWKVVGNPTSQNFLISPSAPANLAPGAFYVLARSAFALVPFDFVYDTLFNHHDSTDDIILYDASGVEQDRVEYGNSWPVATGQSMALELPSLDNNDRRNWCLSSAFYGPTAAPRDKGTPGVKNDCPGFNPP
jgi:uncharacterized protein